jgi:hypothetical protein
VGVYSGRIGGCRSVVDVRDKYIRFLQLINCTLDRIHIAGIRTPIKVLGSYITNGRSVTRNS